MRPGFLRGGEFAKGRGRASGFMPEREPPLAAPELRGIICDGKAIGIGESTVA